MYSCTIQLFTINVTQFFVPNNYYSFSFEQMLTKHGRIRKRCSESNMVEPKFDLKSFRLLATFAVTVISKR